MGVGMEFDSVDVSECSSLIVDTHWYCYGSSGYGCDYATFVPALLSSMTLATGGWSVSGIR